MRREIILISTTPAYGTVHICWGTTQDMHQPHRLQNPRATWLAVLQVASLSPLSVSMI